LQDLIRAIEKYINSRNKDTLKIKKKKKESNRTLTKIFFPPPGHTKTKSYIKNCETPKQMSALSESLIVNVDPMQKSVKVRNKKFINDARLQKFQTICSKGDTFTFSKQ
jgi:hypothetical protein